MKKELIAFFNMQINDEQREEINRDDLIEMIVERYSMIFLQLCDKSNNIIVWRTSVLKSGDAIFAHKGKDFFRCFILGDRDFLFNENEPIVITSPLTK